MICKILFEYNRKIAYDMKKCQTLDIKYFQLFVKTSKGKYSLGKLKKIFAWNQSYWNICKQTALVYKISNVLWKYSLVFRLQALEF